MTAQAETWSIAAQWICPADGRRIHRGVLRGRGPVIEQIGPAGSVPPTDHHRDLGDVVVLPGLVNAHTHLELTGLRGKLPPHRPMPQWLFGLSRSRPDREQRLRDVADGAEEALSTGTTALADLSAGNRSWRALRDSPLRTLCLGEVAGIGPLEKKGIQRLGRLLRGGKTDEGMRFGIAPHAPYTAGEQLFKQAVQLAKDKGVPISTHLAESEAERQFLTHGTGPLFEYLARMGMIDSSVRTQGCRPVEFAMYVGLLDVHSILAHVNFLDDRELALLARHKRASVVYCPRACEFFARSGHRYREMLAKGINVALGTDSLASNVSLNMLAEMRRVRQEARVDNQTILSMATLHGARALGWDDRIGSLVPGKQADWIAVELPGQVTGPLETILTSAARVLEVHIAGRLAWPQSETPAKGARFHQQGSSWRSR